MLSLKNFLLFYQTPLKKKGEKEKGNKEVDILSISEKMQSKALTAAL